MTRKIIGLFSLIFITALSSCSSDSNDNNPTSGSSISATINGQTWASIEGGAIANIQNVDVGVESTTVLQIIGAKPDMSVLTIQFPVNGLAVGTHTFTGDAGGLMSYVPAGSSGTFYTSAEPGGSFTVTITSIDLQAKTFSGTFSGTIVDLDGNSITVTNGVIHSVPFMNSQLYSNGTMSLSRNTGTTFTMDADNSDGKWLFISQTTGDNSISIIGNNTNLSPDFGTYQLTFPSDVTPGTYNLTNAGFDATISHNEGQAEFNLTSGTITISSHNGNIVTGTFSYTVSNGTQTVGISEGNFNITHN